MRKLNNPPPDVTPKFCDSFTADTDAQVEWQNIPATGCTTEQDGTETWPFNVASPIILPSPSTISIAVSAGTYTINVKCCTSGMLKTVTYPKPHTLN